MFLHASAVFSILLNGEDKDCLLDKLQAAHAALMASRATLITSHVEILESVLSVSKAKQISTDVAGRLVGDFMTALTVTPIPLTSEIVRLAAKARVDYGKPHRAEFNAGDALAYACAKNYRRPLLYTGKCFRHTDLA